MTGDPAPHGAPPASPGEDDWADRPPPEVTVAMPAYNAGRFIREAIESVLQQEGIELELIVVDDGSRDDTAAVAESIRDPRLTVQRNARRRGIGACHNLIVRRSRAPYIAHVDADDTVLPGALRKLVDAVATNPGVGQAHCHFVSVDVRGRATRASFNYWWQRLRRDRPPTLDYRAALASENVANALRTYRRAALYAAGDFDERLPFGVDYDMALRLVERCRIKLVPEFLYARRIHGQNTTEGLWFKAFRFWSISYRIRRRLIRAGHISFLRSPNRNLRGFLRTRWAKMGERVRARLGRAARRVIAVARWRLWAPWAATLHRQAVRRLSWWPLAWREPRRAVPAGAPRLIYYLRLFPALSETFIQREVAALVELGVPLEVVAEEPYDAEHFDEEARRLAARTTYLGAPAAVSPAALFSFVVRRPLTVLNLFLYVLLRAHGARKSWAADRAVWRRVLRLAGVLRERGATHVHAPWATADALVALLAARLAGTRYTVQARASDLYQHDSQSGLEERLRHADFIITNAQSNVAAIRSKLPAGVAKDVHTIYEGVDLRRLTSAHATERGAVPRILSVARLVEPKGVEVLLRACRILRDQGLAFGCEVIGGRVAQETNYYVALRKLWHSLGLEADVQFLGARPFAALREKYAEADVYVLAAVPAPDGRRDVTPNTIIEAMAMRLPIVSTRSGAIPELIEDGVSGLLVAPGDDKALADAIARLLGDGDLRRTLGGAARRRVEERFDIIENAARYAALFGFPSTTRSATVSGTISRVAAEGQDGS